MKRFIIIFLLLTAAMEAQSQSGASLGMGLNYNALARGSAAMNWNPALLDFERPYGSDFSLLSFTTVTANNSFSWKEVDYYFEKGKILTDQEKNDFIGIIKDDGLNLFSDTYITLFSFAYKNFGASLSSVNRAYGNIPKDFFELAMMPTELGRVYDFSSLDVSGYSAAVASMAYAHNFNLGGFSFSAGIQGNFYAGLGTVVTDTAVARFGQGEDGNINSLYILQGKKAEPGGMGFSLDLGLAAKMFDEKLDLSLSFKNLFGSINWSNKAEVFYQVGKIDSVSLDKLFKGDYPKADTSYAISGFSTGLPVYMNLGAAFHLNPDLTLTANWKQGLNEAFGNNYTPRIGIGVEYFVTEIIPIRGGFTVGGNVGTLFTLGSGLRFSGFHLDGAFGMSRGMLPKQSTGFIGSLSFRFLF